MLGAEGPRRMERRRRPCERRVCDDRYAACRRKREESAAKGVGANSRPSATLHDCLFSPSIGLSQTKLDRARGKSANSPPAPRLKTEGKRISGHLSSCPNTNCCHTPFLFFADGYIASQQCQGYCVVSPSCFETRCRHVMSSRSGVYGHLTVCKNQSAQCIGHRCRRPPAIPVNPATI